MTDGRGDARVDLLLRRLDVVGEPDPGYVASSLANLAPVARDARRLDGTPFGRLRRDLAVALAPRRSWPSPRRITVAGALILLALILMALLIVVLGSRRNVPPPFGLAENGRIAFVADDRIWTSNPDGNDRRQLTFGAVGQTDPRFSQDGTRIAYKQFASDDRGRADVAVADADGRNQVIVARGVAELSHIAWSPDGRFVAFSGSIGDGPVSGWIGPSDGSAAAVAFTSVPGAWDPVWSPDGQQLAIGATAGLLVMDRDGGNVRRLNHATYTEIGERGEIAEWSPDGSRLVFTAFTGDGNSDFQQEVYVVGLDGGPERLVSSDMERARDASWSPDGTHIAFMRNGPTDGPHVVITDPDGANVVTLYGAYGWYQPIWSPDGTKIVVTDDIPGIRGVEAPAVRVILDVADRGAHPVVIPAPGLTPEAVPDWAASWQRLAR